MKRSSWLFLGIALIVAFGAMVVLSTPADAGPVEDAIAKRVSGT